MHDQGVVRLADELRRDEDQCEERAVRLRSDALQWRRRLRLQLGRCSPTGPVNSSDTDEETGGQFLLQAH